MSPVSQVLAPLSPRHQEVDLNSRIHKTIVSQWTTMKRFLEFAFLRSSTQQNISFVFIGLDKANCDGYDTN